MYKSLLRTSLLVLAIFFSACQKDELTQNNLRPKNNLKPPQMVLCSIPQTNSRIGLKTWFILTMDLKKEPGLSTVSILSGIIKLKSVITLCLSPVTISHQLQSSDIHDYFYISTKNNIPHALFYDIVPNDQNQTSFNQDDIDFFDGSQITYDIFDGYADRIVYELGEPSAYMNESNYFELKCPGCTWWNLDPTQTDESTGAGGGSSYVYSDPTRDRGGRTLCMNEPCPNGFSISQCKHKRIDCSGGQSGGGFDITVVNIAGNPGWMIYNAYQDNSTRGGNRPGGGTGTGNQPGGGGGSSSKPKNPVDEAGLNEIECYHARTVAAENYLDNNPHIDLTVTQMLSVLGPDDPCGLNQDEFEAALELALIMDACSQSTATLEDCIAFLTDFRIVAGGSPIDLDAAIEDCFGSVDSNGNYIDCDTYNGSLSFTIYVDQPVAGKNFVFHQPTKDVGHTFVSFSSIENSEESTLVFGFYPAPGAGIDPHRNVHQASSVVDDGAHEFDVSLTFLLDCDQFNNGLQMASAAGAMTYSLNENNCSDFAILVANATGQTIPDTYKNWYVGGGTNPGSLGEDLRTYSGADASNTSGGTAPDSKCN